MRQVASPLHPRIETSPMLQRFPVAFVLLSLLAAGTADAQSQPPPEGNMPTLCDITRFSTSKPTGDDDSPPDDDCPAGRPDRPTPGPAPRPRPDPFIPDPPPIRSQN